MGTQCNIILTYYTDRKHEEIKKEIYSFLNLYPGESGTIINNEGDRAFAPAEMQCHVIAMKDWEEKECLKFIENLKRIDWDVPKSVQVYYQPATHENYLRFKLVNLFE